MDTGHVHTLDEETGRGDQAMLECFVGIRDLLDVRKVDGNLRDRV